MKNSKYIYALIGVLVGVYVVPKLPFKFPGI